MFNLLFLAVFILAFCLFYRILSPFLTTLAWAAITMIIIVILVIILLSGFFLNLIAKELADVYNYCEQFIK